MEDALRLSSEAQEFVAWVVLIAGLLILAIIIWYRG